MCYDGYRLHQVKYNECNVENKQYTNVTCPETCSTLDIWFGGQEKPITFMTCGGKGSLSLVKDMDSDCKPTYCPKQLEAIKAMLGKICETHLNVSSSSGCCKMMGNIEAATMGYCKGDLCNGVYCNKHRHLPNDQKCNENMPKNGTTITIPASENTTVVPNTTITNGKGITKNESQATTNSGNGTTSSGTMVDFFDLNFAILFQILILTFVLINSSA